MAAEPDNIRRRSACDRCHSQKLRCPRRPGVDVCDRCAKARASCVYSPFRQKTIIKDPVDAPQARQGKSNPYNTAINEAGSKRKRTPPLNLNHNGLDASVQQEPLILDTTGFDWTSTPYSSFTDLDIETGFGDFNFNTLHDAQPLNTLYSTSDSSGLSDTPSPVSFDAGPDQISSMPFTFEPLQAFHMESPSSIHAFDTINFTPQDQEHPLGRFIASSPKSWEATPKELHPEASQKCIRQLSELSISLYEHSITLPAQSMSKPILGQDHAISKSHDRHSKFYNDFNLDETFQLTQNLIEIYPSFIDVLRRRQSAILSMATLNNGSLYAAQWGLEESSILLILSCHLRLIEIYEELFPHMEVCIAQKGKAYSPPMVMNENSSLRFGSYTPPLSSTVSMQMMFLVQLAKKLLDCSTELSKVTGELKDLEVKEEAAGNRNTMGAGSLDISVITAENVKGRASNMAQQLGTLRDLMLQMDIFA